MLLLAYECVTPSERLCLEFESAAVAEPDVEDNPKYESAFEVRVMMQTVRRHGYGPMTQECLPQSGVGLTVELDLG